MFVLHITGQVIYLYISPYFDKTLDLLHIETNILKKKVENNIQSNKKLKNKFTGSKLVVI